MRGRVSIFDFVRFEIRELIEKEGNVVITDSFIGFY